MSRTFRYLLLTCLLAISAGGASAQRGPLFPVDEPANRLIRALFDRGLLTDVDPVSGPFTESSLRSTVLESGSLDGALQRALNRLLVDVPGTEVTAGIRLRPGVRASSGKRLDVLRAESTGDPSLYPYAVLEGFLAAGGWTANVGLRHDLYYDRDPEGADAANRLYARLENTYVRYDGRWARFFLGRTGRHWGLPGGSGLILSDNPRPMDHLSLTIGPENIHIQATLSELDSWTDPRRFLAEGREPDHRRFLAAHRFAFHTGEWRISLLHAILYSDPSAGLSLKFMNPLNVALFSIDGQPKNDENNGLVGFDIAGRMGQTSAHVQMMLDDLDILNGNEPASVAGTVDLTQTNLRPGWDARLEATVVSSRTYNALQEPGKYTYLGRGIGTQYSDFVAATARVDWLGGFPRMGLILSPGVSMLVQGNQDFRRPFPDNDGPGALLDGPRERTIRPFLNLFWISPDGITLTASAGFNSVSQSGGTDRSSSSFFSGGIQIAWRWSRAWEM